MSWPKSNASPRNLSLRSSVASLLGGRLGVRWVVGVSGGSDSTGLLRLLADVAPEFDLKLSVAHVDHGTRGEAGRADAEFARALAERLGLPFDPATWRPERASHFEEDARRARYERLVEIARRREAVAVAVGHTRDDQAETILQRVLRGTGLAGLEGMRERRPLAEGIELVRPILTRSRAEIVEYLDAIGQPFRTDATNADVRRSRSRIRHDLLPKLAAEFNPDVSGALIRLGEIAAEANREWDPIRERLFENALIEAVPGRVRLDREAIRALSSFARAEVLRRAWRAARLPERELSAERLRRMAERADSPGSRFRLPGGIACRVTHDFIEIGRDPEPTSASRVEPARLPIPGEVVFAGLAIRATIDARVVADACRTETIDLDRLSLPLSAGFPLAGERFDPLGMHGRTMPLNDFLRARRVPRESRGRVPLVRDASGIVWVVGERIAERVKMTESTRRTVRLEIVSLEKSTDDPGGPPRPS